MNIRIRRVRQEDIGFIYEMICDLEHQRLNRREFNAVFRANLQNPDVHYLIAFNNDTPVGFGSLHIQRLLHHAGAVGEVQELYTSPDARGLGIGKQLLAALRRISVKKKCKNLEVTSNRRREAAHRFYVREGMQQSHFKFVEELSGDADE
ncbi:MAG: GNAT family N-acetyltransferase [Leptonema illini]|jgi:PhnO protein|uniref:GNAT family N-acetyltransferase n=1 Tax=Leptonema illini TaxID=183 RepID=A0A833GXI3_9LEPT|nr:MAG: GNAT family N-acetyltransferase [Leptonema illini]